MFSKLGKVSFNVACQSIHFTGYPFPSIRDITLEHGDICEIVDWYPPAILTHQNEFLIFSREHWDVAVAFANQTSIATSQRQDIWSLILDPFLDTVLSDDHYQHTDAILRQAGLTKQAVGELRQRLDAPMMRLTALTWEWGGYSLYDALNAFKPLNPMKQAEWRRFYAEAMTIALKTPEPKLAE